MITWKVPLRRRRSHRAWIVGTLAVATALSACSLPERSTGASDSQIDVVVSTEIIADLVRQVGGDRVSATTVVPEGGDPHSFEPTPKDARTVASADLAFTNHLLLETHALIKMFDTNVPDGTPNIALAESAEQYGASLIPLVENLQLDTIWLGFAVRGDTERRSDEIELRGTRVEGPGELSVYLTQTLGDPERYITSADNLGAADLISLPPDAHTHVNWAFSRPGEYRLSLEATLVSEGRRTSVGSGTIRFAVGVDPTPLAQGSTVLDDGHTDIAVDLDTKQIVARTDEQGDIQLTDALIEVPNHAVEEVPRDERFGFLGNAGAKVWQLPQAVLGKHVHGEIDPHLWHDVRNARAYVRAIADALTEVDPDGREIYYRNRDGYVAQLDELHREVASTLSTIPQERRQLVTTHDAFGYLARAYGLTVAGFVVPNPAQEPSAAQVRELSDTIRRVDVPAVFVEPNLQRRADVLRRVARDAEVDVCSIHGDTFSEVAQDYVAMMRHNSQELARCLTQESS
ncbi:MAG: anchored repeat ABC transporter, substrate-binding protein [Actinomycetota bacterium]